MSDSNHAMCEWYGHDWKKNLTLSAKASRNVRIERCDRCGKRRRVANV
jgi:hypothetical protein